MADTSEDAPLLSSEEVAAKLNISSRCVLNWYYDDIMPAAVHVGKVIRFREADVMEALEKAKKRQAWTGPSTCSIWLSPRDPIFLAK